jgi:hypothetical protein
LAQGYSKTFVTTRRDETQPDIAQWGIVTPPHGTKEALVIHFPDPLDHFLVRDGIKILNSAGDFLAGDITMESEERIFKFTPAEPWSKGHCELQVEGRLEDLSGNNLNRPFDRDLDDKTEHQQQEIFIKEFEIF